MVLGITNKIEVYVDTRVLPSIGNWYCFANTKGISLFLNSFLVLLAFVQHIF